MRIINETILVVLQVGNQTLLKKSLFNGMITKCPY